MSQDKRTLTVGHVAVFERRFTDEDVAAFAHLSGDAGRHHARPDARGRRIVHGLLTATLPTKIGGDLSFLARDMTFEFLRPVFTGDTIRCEATIAAVEPEVGRVRVTFRGSAWNQDGKEVLRFVSNGVVLDEDP
jgi:acyl dehydratase